MHCKQFFYFSLWELGDDHTEINCQHFGTVASPSDILFELLESQHNGVCLGRKRASVQPFRSLGCPLAGTVSQTPFASVAP